MTIEKSKDLYCAYSDNCDGIYAAGETMEDAKADTYRAIDGIKRNLPEERWPKQIKGEYEIEWNLEVASFLEYYGSIMSLSGMK